MSYLKHFVILPGAPGWMVAFAPIILIIEGISHLARALSLTIRLFGNIFGEELVILILATARAVRRAAADDGAGPRHQHAPGPDFRNP